MFGMLGIAAGIVAPILYAVTVVAGAAATPGYSHARNAISELIQTGAPAKASLDPWFLVYNGLVVMFGVALAQAFEARTDRHGRGAGRFAGGVLAMVGVLGGVMTLWFPMDPIGSEATPAGTGHVVLAGLVSLGSIVAMASAGLAFSRSGRWAGYGLYSFVSVAVVFATGAMAAWSAATGSGWMGLWERLTIGAFLQWLLVVALAVMARRKRPAWVGVGRRPGRIFMR
ncbi:MAG: DUF998 domain-containing protein [Limnochordaceae bacterium]|nr:DUF998 domain-containing protein [Limnochordaceae bacterium]